MTYKYRYKGRGLISFFAGKERYTLGGEDYPKVTDTIELEEKVSHEELELIKEEEKPSRRTRKKPEEIGGG